jgi:hypothetical protein
VAGCGKRLLWPSYKAIVRVLDRVGVEKQQGELNSLGISKNWRKVYRDDLISHLGCK